MDQDHPSKRSEPLDLVRPGTPRRLFDRLVLSTIAERLTKEDGHKDAVEAEIRRHADELAGPSATPIEQTLAQTAAICWASLRMAESEDLATKFKFRSQAEFTQRRIDRAHKRYIATLKALATVRKLALPSIQINVARDQVNMQNPTLIS